MTVNPNGNLVNQTRVGGGGAAVLKEAEAQEVQKQQGDAWSPC